MDNPSSLQPMVAIFNSADDILERLQGYLAEAGFRTVTGCLADVHSGTLDLVAFVDDHDPEVLLIDVPRPHERHLNFLRLLRHVGPLGRCGWVLRTIQKEALEVLLGPVDNLGVIAESGGAEEIVGAVRRALVSCRHEREP